VDAALEVPVRAAYAGEGIGLGLRLGRRIPMPGAWQTFELGFAFGNAAHSESNVAPGSISTYRGLAGMRLGLSGILQPGLFAHAGFGHVSGETARRQGDQILGREDFSHTAFTWDVGVYLDLVPASSIGLGAHASYNQIVKTSQDHSFQWYDIGGHFVLWL
jgi:hypothetical protein